MQRQFYAACHDLQILNLSQNWFSYWLICTLVVSKIDKQNQIILYIILVNYLYFW